MTRRATGPKTAAGKAVSAKNARKHGGSRLISSSSSLEGSFTQDTVAITLLSGLSEMDVLFVQTSDGAVLWANLEPGTQESWTDLTASGAEVWVDLSTSTSPESWTDVTR